MSASLLEMVLAIAIAGLLFVGAIVPTTQSVIAYQEAETAMRELTTHALAALRAEQVASVIWRDGDPPVGYAPPQTATRQTLQVGDWTLREKSGVLEQQWKARAWSPLAENVSQCSFQYLLRDGDWVTSVASDELSNIIAVRLGWLDSASEGPFGSVVVPADRAFADHVIKLDAPDTSQAYRRRDYERKASLSLGSWR